MCGDFPSLLTNMEDVSLGSFLIHDARRTEVNTCSVAFLIPYWCSMVGLGLPGLYLEYIIGQYTQSGAPVAYRKVAPFFQGTSIPMTAKYIRHI